MSSRRPGERLTRNQNGPDTAPQARPHHRHPVGRRRHQPRHLHRADLLPHLPEAARRRGNHPGTPGPPRGGRRPKPLPLAGQSIPLVQVALQERRRPAQLRSRRGLRLHGFAGEGRATGRRVLPRRRAGDRRPERAEAGSRRAGFDRLPQARSRHQGRNLRVPAHPPRSVRPERPVPHAASDPGVHGGDGRSRSRRHRLRPCLRHGRLPDRRRGLHPGSLQRTG